MIYPSAHPTEEVSERVTHLPAPQRWLLRRPQTDAPARLFCLPYSGVGASMYTRWPSTIGPAEVCLIQLPGRENRLREPHYGSYENLADMLANALLPYLDRPFGFFGHCGGALPAVAAALYLARSGLPTPAQLFVSSQVAPHEGPYGRFLGMSDAELTQELASLIRALGGTPHPELIEMNLSVLRADVAANRAYRLPAPAPLPGTLHSIGWRDDREVSPSLMDGWSAYVPAERFLPTVLPGEHYAFLDAPAPLLDVLARGMAEAVNETSGSVRESIAHP